MTEVDLSPPSLTRRALFDLVWSKPLTTIAAELGTSSYHVRAMCERLLLPVPLRGHWMKHSVGKAAKPPIYPRHDQLDGEAFAIPRPRLRPIISAPQDANRGPIDVRMAGPQSDDRVAQEASAERPTAQPSEAVEPEILLPVSLTREELHALVWTTPMMRLGERFGISGPGLAKVCARLSVPCPPRGHWAKLAAGKPSPRIALGPAKAGAPASVVLGRAAIPDPGAAERAAGVDAVAETLAALPKTKVRRRLDRPHPVIAGWLANHARRVEEARKGRDIWGGRPPTPPPLTPLDHRMHRILDALFKALERSQVSIEENDRKELLLVRDGERIHLTIREKLKRIRRPLRDDEKEWSYLRERGWVQELLGSGLLALEIKTWLPPGFRQKWEEGERASLDTWIPEILATVIAAFPRLAARTRERAERERREWAERQIRQRERLEAQTERNRWRRLVEIAGRWSDAQNVSALLRALQTAIQDPEAVIEGRSLRDWLAWAEEQVAINDPSRLGAEAIFADLADVTSGTYPDQH